METRVSLIATAQRQAEDTRIQVRKAQQAGVKRGKFEKHSIELEEVRSPLNQSCRSDLLVVVHAFSVSETHESLCRRH
jgi:ribosome recycling factor